MFNCIAFDKFNEKIPPSLLPLSYENVSEDGGIFSFNLSKYYN